MPYTEASKRATLKYMKKLKRIPLDMQIPQYSRLKAYCDHKGSDYTVVGHYLFEKIDSEMGEDWKN